MAIRPRPVSNSRLRDDVGTDDGDRRHPILREIFEQVSQCHCAGNGAGSRCSQGLGGLGLLSTGQATSGRGPADRPRARRRDSSGPSRGPRTSRSRALHRRCGLVLRLRSSGADRRGQQPARARSSSCVTGRSQERGDPEANLASRRAPCPGRRRRDLQSGADGTRCVGLYAAAARLPDLPPIRIM